MTTLISCDGLAVSAGNKQLFENLDWTVKSGEVWGVLGRNGCGKTTLLHTLAGLHAVDKGHISIKDHPIQNYAKRQLARQIGVLLRESVYSFPIQVREIIESGRYPWHAPLAALSGDDQQIITKAIERMQIHEFAERAANTLSGGEMRRVAMATLLSQNPAIALLDEPENHLDPGVREHLLRIVCQQFSDNNHATIMVLHDPSLATRLCSHLLLLFDNGQILTGPTQEMATSENLTRLYQHTMHAVDVDSGTLFYSG